MRFNKLFKVVASVLLASKVAAEGDVVALTKDDYEVTLESTPLALVKVNKLLGKEICINKQNDKIFKNKDK